MMRDIATLLLTAVLLAAVSTMLAGCNTVEGMGQDIQQGGKALKDEAREHK